MKFFSKLFGSSNTNVPAKTAYEIGYNADTTEKEIRHASADLLAPNDIINPDKYDIFKGALDAVKEGRYENMAAIVDLHFARMPILMTAMTAENVTKAEFEAVFGRYPKMQDYLDTAFGSVVNTPLSAEEKISTLEKMIGLGAVANAFNGRAVRDALLRKDEPIVDFLRANNAKVEDAIAAAAKRGDKETVKKLNENYTPYRMRGDYPVS